MPDKVAESRDITLTVGLNEERLPVRIHWRAEQQSPAPREAKAFLLSIFDKENLDTLRIDLWTKEMQIIEMDRFVFQTMRGLADTYFKATQNAELATAMQQFVQFFGEKTGILKQE